MLLACDFCILHEWAPLVTCQKMHQKKVSKIAVSWTVCWTKSVERKYNLPIYHQRGMIYFGIAVIDAQVASLETSYFIEVIPQVEDLSTMSGLK